MGSPQYFLTQDGQLKAVEPAAVGFAKDSGWKPVGSDLDAARAARDAGTIGGKLKTAASGVTSGAFDAFTALPRAGSAIGSAALGTADPLADMTGRNLLQTGAYVAGGEGLPGARAAQEFAAGERARATENPYTAGAASLVGNVAGAGLGGLGAIGSGVGGAVTRGLGGKVAARIAGAAATGAVEGAPLSLIAAQDQAYIENRQLTGEQAMAALGTGALVGGIFAGGAKGLGELYGAATGRLAARAAEATATETTPAAERSSVKKFLQDIAGTSDENFTKSIEATVGQPAMPEAVNYARAGARGENLAEARAAVQGNAARELRAHINQMEEATSNLTPEWRELKAANVAKTIAKDEGAFEAQSELAQNQLGAIRDKINELRGDPLGYSQVGLKKLDDKIALAERKLGTAIESGKGEELMVTLDTLKRDMGPHGRGSDFGLSSAERATKTEVRGLYEGLRQSLMSDAWGQAGEMQRQVNAPFTDWLNTKRLFDQRFLTETGREGWEKTVGADPGKIEPFVRGLGKSSNDLTHSIIEQHIESTKTLAEALSKAGELTPGKAAELDAITKAAQGFKAAVNGVQEKVGAIDQAETWLGKSEKSHGVLGPAAIGGYLAGPIGAAIGTAATFVGNSPQALAKRLMIEEAAGRAIRVVGSTLDGFFTGAKRAMASTGEVSGGIARAPAALARSALPVATALEVFQGRHATPEIAYKARVDEVIAANDNYGQRIRDNAGHVFGSTADADPHSVGAAVVSTTKAMQFLQAKIPAPLLNSQSLTPNASRYVPSRMEIAQYADLWTAVSRPLDVIKALPTGSPTQDQIQAIRAVYPRLYQYVREETMKRLAKLDQAGTEVPIRERIILDTLLDLNGAGEPTFTAAFAAKYGPLMTDATDNQEGDVKPPAPKGGGNAAAFAKRQTTKTDEMIGG